MVSAPQRYGSTNDGICSSDSTLTQSQNCIRSAPYALLSNRFPSPGHPPETHSHLWRLSHYVLRMLPKHMPHQSTAQSLPLATHCPCRKGKPPLGVPWVRCGLTPGLSPVASLPWSCRTMFHTHQSPPFSGGFPGCLPGNPHSARATCMAVCKIFYLPHSLNLLSFLLTTSPSIIHPFCISLIFTDSKRIPN